MRSEINTATKPLNNKKLIFLPSPNQPQVKELPLHMKKAEATP